MCVEQLLTEGRGHLIANSAPDINAELDELDREEFYRLKKVH